MVRNTALWSLERKIRSQGGGDSVRVEVEESARRGLGGGGGCGGGLARATKPKIMSPAQLALFCFPPLTPETAPREERERLEKRYQ